MIKKKKQKISEIFWLALWGVFLSPVGLWAQPPVVPSAPWQQGLGLGGYLINLLTQLRLLARTILPLLFGLAVLFFFWGAAVFILNADNEEKRKEGKQRMFWGVVAIFILASIFGIIQLLTIIFGVGSPAFPGFPGPLP